MKVRYSNQDPYTGNGWEHPPEDENGISIPSEVVFLAGPTPRSKDVKSWRPQAIKILEEIDGYEGMVLVPEPSDGQKFVSYTFQVEWERECLFNCSTIFFWVPREMQTMPALTTNIEFWYWIARDPLKVIYGRPHGAPHTSYLDWLYKKETGREPFDNLQRMLSTVVGKHNYNSVMKFGQRMDRMRVL